jgi:hypothetical protein
MRRLALFLVLLALVAGGAAALGAATRGPEQETSQSGMAMHDESTSPAAHEQASGLETTAGGFTFEPAKTSFDAGRSTFRFRILDAHGAPAHDFTQEGGVRLHLILARRDLTGYAHLHPQLLADGSWTVPVDFATPGVYRAYADFERDGEKTVLGRDLFVAGPMRPQPLPKPRSSVTVDGYRVDLAAPALHAGKPSVLDFAVSRNGRAVESFQSYVGMRGHLIALHDGDLAYSHVHPLEGSATGRIGFETELDAAGAYRLFLQFKVGVRVHTAPFTIEVQR